MSGIPEEPSRLMIVQTNSELIAARHAYYVLGKPIMTDAQYDAAERDLADMVRALPQFAKLATVLHTVGSDMVHESGRVRHTTPMLSLENSYTLDDLKAWLGVFPGESFVIEPKVDGASCSLLYLDRKLVKAVTRGDGQYGEDVTKQMAASGAVPLELPDEFFPSTPVEIRGEVFLPRARFDAINQALTAAGEEPYMSPRNLAVGTMKLLDLEVVSKRGLKLFVWQVDGIPEEYLQKRNLSAQFAHHSSLYVTQLLPIFPQSHITLPSDNPDAIVQAVDTTIKQEREAVWHNGIGMDTDGVVIKLVSPEARKKAGGGSKYANWAVSFKYQNQSGVTTLLDVIWQTGRTGRMTPVGVLEPIVLGGAQISRVNLNNWSWMQDIGIKEVPCQVEIIRSGDVIPKVERVVV